MKFKIGDKVKFVKADFTLDELLGKVAKIRDIKTIHGAGSEKYLCLDIEHPKMPNHKVALYESLHWDLIINLDNPQYKNFNTIKEYLGISDE